MDFTPCKAQQPLQGMELQEKEAQTDRQRIDESSCARKETADIDIFLTSRNGDRKIMQSIRITSSDEYLPTTYKKDLSWLHFDNEPRIQEKQQVKDQQSCIFVFAAYLLILSSS